MTVELSNTEFHGAAEDEPNEAEKLQQNENEDNEKRSEVARTEVVLYGRAVQARLSRRSACQQRKNAESAVVRISARANRLGLYR